MNPTHVCGATDADVPEPESAHRASESEEVELTRVIQLLAHGRLELTGQVLSTNSIFLVTVDDGALRTLAIYKPRRGETPLWDFPSGTLGLREVCAYLVSQALGWPLIPPIVLRDGPYGPGTVQLYIDADPGVHYFVFREEKREELLPIALFDLIANNADRKAGHVLLDRQGRVWAIDNALTFHAEPKLRTVIWDYAGQPIPEPYLDDIRALHTHLATGGELRRLLGQLLSKREIAAFLRRLGHLLETREFPFPDPNRRQVPWPLI